MTLRAKPSTAPFAAAVVSFAVLCCMGSCGGGGDDGPVTPSAPTPVATVIVSPPTATVEVGSSVQLTATARDAQGKTLTGPSIVWASANPAIVSVSGSGLVTGVSAGGPIPVRATAEGKTGSADLTVAAPVVPTALQVVSGTNQTATIGTVLPLPVNVRVLDSRAHPMAGVQVAFSTLGSGRATPSSGVTDVDGQLQVEWTLGVTEGTQRLKATVNAGTGSIETEATASATSPLVEVVPEGGVVSVAGGAVEIETSAGAVAATTPIQVVLDDTSASARVSGYPILRVSPPLEQIDPDASVTIKPLPGITIRPSATVARVMDDGRRVFLPSGFDQATGAVSAVMSHSWADVANSPKQLRTTASAAGAIGNSVTYEVLDASLQLSRKWWYRVENAPSEWWGSGDALEGVKQLVRESLSQWAFYLNRAPYGIDFRELPPAGTQSSDPTAPSQPDIEIRFVSGATIGGAHGEGSADCSSSCSTSSRRHVWVNGDIGWRPDKVLMGAANMLNIVLLHELGHTLGLRHYNYDKGCDNRLIRWAMDGTCGVNGEAVMAYIPW